MKPVDSLSSGKSPYGAHHMAGNVWEWVADWYDENYYKRNVAENPAGNSSGEYRILRGGSWGSVVSTLRTADRVNSRPEFRNDDVGCRCSK